MRRPPCNRACLFRWLRYWILCHVDHIWSVVLPRVIFISYQTARIFASFVAHLALSDLFSPCLCLRFFRWLRCLNTASQIAYFCTVCRPYMSNYDFIAEMDIRIVYCIQSILTITYFCSSVLSCGMIIKKISRDYQCPVDLSFHILFYVIYPQFIFILFISLY